MYPLRFRMYPLQLGTYPSHLRMYPLQLGMYPLCLRTCPLQLRMYPFRRRMYPFQPSKDPVFPQNNPPHITPNPLILMPKQYFLPTTNSGKSQKFTQFKDNIGPYTITFGIAAGDITQQGADALYFAALLPFADTVGNAARQWNAWRDIVLTGVIGTEPVLITKPVGFPGSVPAGILTRYLLLVNAIKAHKNYTTAIGDILGIEGSQETPPDLNTIQPIISATATATVVKILWGWLRFRAFLAMCEIQVNRGSGWTALVYDTTPNYEDTHPFPATPTIWKYRAIYRVADHQVGLWSLEVSVTVGG